MFLCMGVRDHWWIGSVDLIGHRSCVSVCFRLLKWFLFVCGLRAMRGLGGRIWFWLVVPVGT